MEATHPVMSGVPRFDKDDKLLAELGYKPELKRNFSVIQVFGIAFSIMSLLPSIASSISFSLLSGPIGLTWGWIVPSVFVMSVGIAMSEMGSALPTSGGLYWWTFKFSSPALKRPLCWLAGYSNTLGLIGGLCSIDYGFASFVLAIPSLVSDDYTPSLYHLYGVYAACVISHIIVGSLANEYMSKLQTFCIITNLVVIVVTIIALPIGTKNSGRALNSGKFVYSVKENLTEWPLGWSWISSWLAAIWTIGAFDSCVHMAEEASNAATAVPFGILMSIGMCGILGFFINSILAACIDPDIVNVANSPYGAMAQIYLDSLGKNWAIGMMVFIFIIQWFMGLSIIVAASRQCWAFSRDGALPFSRWLAVVNKKSLIPVRALIFIGVISLIIGCLCMIDEAAASALFSLASASNSLAWMLPIAARAISFDPAAFNPGPFYLGPLLSRINCVIASVYLFFVICFIAMFPREGPNPTPQNMNYTCVINGFVWIGCMVYYFVDGRKWFEGPKITLSEEDLAEIEGVDIMGVHPEITNLQSRVSRMSEKGPISVSNR